MKVIVADKISPTGVAFLREQEGFEVVEAYGSSPEKVLELAADASAFVVRSETKITREVLENAPQLKVVGRAGVGVDNVDIDAASEHGVIVMNTPGGNTIATAELTFTHMLCGARPIAQACQSMREGRWDRKKFGGSELFGKTLGILGLGRIGAEVASRAQAFGMSVVAYDPFLVESRAKALGVEPMELDGIFEKADYITVHLPLTDETRGMISTQQIAKMKDGVRLFNCARGGVIDEEALAEALKSGKVASAGLDVYSDEPLAEDSPLRNIPNLVLTPHLGASTSEAQENVGIEIAHQVADVLKGGSVRNAVNLPAMDGQVVRKLQPYLHLGLRLGSFAQQITPDRVESLVITYFGKLVELDANALTREILRGYMQRISGDGVNAVNAPILLKRLGIEHQVIKSNEDTDYLSLIRIEAQAGGEKFSVSGTLLGRSSYPRLVEINGREMEVQPEGAMLVLENEDQPGLVGQVGTVLADAGLNIASMALSRNHVGGLALNVVSLDSCPDASVMDKIRALPLIKSLRLVHI